MTTVFVSRLHFPVTTLGPGRRVGIWLQGCSIRCPGCISPDTWAPGLGGADVADVLAAMSGWVSPAVGLTVSGGEPFDQPEALYQILSGWRGLGGGDVLVFTGHEFDRLVNWQGFIDGLVDAVVAGPYDKSKPQTLALRGSDNQSLHLLTERGIDQFAQFQRDLVEADRRLDFMFDDEGGVWFAGIPWKGDFDRLRQRLKVAGHQLSLSERDCPQ